MNDPKSAAVGADLRSALLKPDRDAPTPHRHRRKEHRLAGFDYSEPGSYFVTLCIDGRHCLLADALDATRLSSFGHLVAAAWRSLPAHYGNLELDEFVVMPNHVHGIMNLKRVAEGEKAYSVGAIVQGFKAYTAKDINRSRGTQGARVWQHNYYDRIIRDEAELCRVREYIRNNPSQWMDDGENPGGLKNEGRADRRSALTAESNETEVVTICDHLWNPT